MIPFLSSWKAWLGVLPIAAVIAAHFIPGIAFSIGQFLSTRGGRTITILLALIWLAWMAFAWVDANSYRRGADETKQRIERQDQRAIEAARKARIPVSECYARNGEWSVEEGLCVLPAE
jgi:1,4-dihydroxy-2-naphthoate octaprenyltransferase